MCKPDPDCYLAGLRKLNELRQQERKLPVLASECLAIEDSPPGIQAARASGMRTLGVTNTVTADALRDAGCDNEEIMSHCRSDGPHVRGCWVVDLILGKE